jgi:hypothetical protein
MVEKIPTNKATDDSQIENFAKLEILKKETRRKEEQDYVIKLLNIFTEAEQFKKHFATNWTDYIALLRGDHWPKRRPSYKVDAVINIILENIERKDALLTDAKPIPRVTARSDKHQDTADILNLMMQKIFESSSFNQAMVDMVHNSQTFGNGGVGTVYNLDTLTHRGETEVVAYDPRAYYIDPMVRRPYLLQDGEYNIIEDIWSLAKAKDMYPKIADRIVADANLSRYSMTNKDGFFSRVKQVVGRKRSEEFVASEIPRVFVREFWIRDRQKENNKYVFKNAARKSVLINNVLADDGPNPYDDGLYPLDIMNWHRDFYSCYGWGDVELLKSPQLLLNKIMASVIENINLTSNAIWIGDVDALSKEEWLRLNNAPGSYVKKKPDRELRRESGVPLPSYVLQTMGAVKQGAEESTGMVDVMQGNRTGQVASGVGIESLQMMAQSLIRLRARDLENVQDRIGRKLISRIFQFVPPEEILEVIKDSKNVDDQAMEAITSELLKPIAKRKKNGWTDYAFNVEPGSSLGLAKQQKHIQSLNLRKLEVIDDKALLEDLEYPHRTQVLKRKAAENAAKEKAALQQQGPGGAPGGPQSGQFPMQSGGSPVGRTQ